MICRYFSPARVGSVMPLIGGELLAHSINAVVIELGAVERVQLGDLEDRHARCVIADDDRRLDACRHQRADGVRGRNDLGDRQIDVDVRLEVKFLNGHAVERLRLDILDAAEFDEIEYWL